MQNLTKKHWKIRVYANTFCLNLLIQEHTFRYSGYAILSDQKISILYIYFYYIYYYYIYYIYIFPWIICVDHAEWKDVNSALKNISPSISPPVFLFCAPFSNFFIPHSYCTNLNCSLKSVLYRFLHYVLILFDRTILQSNYGFTYRVLQSTSYSVVLIFIYLNDYRIIRYCDIIKLQVQYRYKYEYTAADKSIRTFTINDFYKYIMCIVRNLKFR